MTVRTSPLLSAFLGSLSSQTTEASSPTPLAPSFAHLDGPTPASITKTMDSLLDTLETHRTEENNVAFHARQIAREKLRAEQYIQRRKEENAGRVAQGLAPLPEEDVSRLFKIPAEPSRLETTLLLGQVDAYAKNLETASAAAIVSLYASQA